MSTSLGKFIIFNIFVIVLFNAFDFGEWFDCVVLFCAKVTNLINALFSMAFNSMNVV